VVIKHFQHNHGPAPYHMCLYSKNKCFWPPIIKQRLKYHPISTTNIDIAYKTKKILVSLVLLRWNKCDF